MALKLNAGDVSRGDLYNIFPEELVLVESDNSRSVPHSQEQIEALAHSILEHHQLQPILARRLEDHRVKVVGGFGRTKAFLYINKVLQPDNPLKIQVRLLDLNAEEAFTASIEENLQRAETTPLDDANAQRKLREVYGWSEQRIADFYQKSVAYIGQLRKTLSLSTELKEEVASGNLPISTAITLTEIPEEERLAVVAEAKDSSGKVNAEVVNRVVRNKKIEEGSGKGRSLKELKTYFEESTGPGETEAIRELSKKLVSFIGGKITDQQLTNALKKWTRPDVLAEAA